MFAEADGFSGRRFLEKVPSLGLSHAYDAFGVLAHDCLGNNVGDIGDNDAVDGHVEHGVLAVP